MSVYKPYEDRVNELLSEKAKIEDCKRTIDELQLAICDRDRKIEILEDNLNRARSEHLEQLRAIIQMLEPLATHEDKGSLYLSHFGKAAMVYMIQKVIYANIKKLDPNLRSAYEDL